MIKLTSFGISIQGSVNTYGDNNAMVKDTNILESTDIGHKVSYLRTVEI
jgi:hypothetical protein